jgi:HK97 family phage major capsid protein
MAELKALQDELVQVLHDAQGIRLKFDGKYESMGAEDAATVDRLFARSEEIKGELDGIKANVARGERLAKLEDLAREARPLVRLHGNQEGLSATKAARWAAAGEDEEGDDGEGRVAIKARSGDERRAWKAFFGAQPYSDMHPDAAKTLKGLFASDMGAGGALVVPQELASQVLTLVKDMVIMRQIANVLPPLVKAESLGVPVLDTEPSDPTWTSELDTGADDTVKPFTKRSLTPHALAKRIKISKKLLRMSVFDPEALVMDRIAYRTAAVEENAFMTGDGAQKPLGIFTASVNGISTARDTVAANASSLVGDDFIKCRFDLKPQYWGKAKWILHRLVLAEIRKLKDSSNNYLWQPGLGGYVAQGTALIGGTPDTLIGLPVYMSEFAPSTLTTGLYAGILGDFSFYWIVDALDMTIERLMELYAETNQVGFILRKETDGMPVLEEPFRRLRMA